MPQLQTLYAILQMENEPHSRITYIVAQLQGCTVDCGVFAAANADQTQSQTSDSNPVLNVSHNQTNHHGETNPEAIKKRRQRQQSTYKKNENERDRKRKHISRQNSMYRQTEQQNQRQLKRKLRQYPSYRQMEKAKQGEYKRKIRQSPTYRQMEKAKCDEYKRKVRQSPTYKEIEKAKQEEYKRKVRQSPSYRQMEKAKQGEYKRKIRQSPTYRQMEKAKCDEYKRKVRQSPTYKEIEKAKREQYKRKVRQSPTYRQMEKAKRDEYKRKVRKSPTYRQMEKAKQEEYKRKVRIPNIQADGKSKTGAIQTKVETIPNIQTDGKSKTGAIQTKGETIPNIQTDGKSKTGGYKRKLRHSPTYRQKEKAKRDEYKRKVRRSPTFTYKEKRKQREFKRKVRQCPTYRKTEQTKQKDAMKTKRLQQSQHLSCLENTIKNFQKACSKIPCYTCTVCFRFLFRKQVVHFHRDKYHNIDDIDNHVYDTPTHETMPACTADCALCTTWICQTCHRNLLSGRTPNQALMNNLFLAPLPPQLQDLNQLERHLISPVIPFMKIMPLPKGLLKGIHGPVVCVPSDVTKLTKTLPRPLNDQTLIKVKLKRKMEYKGHHLYQRVSIPKIRNALQYLKDSNPNYAEDLSQHVADHTDQLYSVAPAEGNLPTSVFDMEMQAFPYHFPDGKNGIHEDRPNKIGLGNYFSTRLFSADQRFAHDPQYIFYGQFVRELKQTTSYISIAVRKGSPSTSDGKKITASDLTNPEKRKELIKSNEGYRFLKTIRGSPPYWEKTLRDLFGMIRQLDIPTWFCSFSAADRRWPEICEAISVQQGKPTPEEIDWNTHCKIINSNPVTACRMFERRVQNFISGVILSPSNPIGKVTDYFFRTEFQSRGWPHIHCLFWCKDAPKFDPDGDNTDFIKYIDKYITCRIPDEEQEPILHEIVTSVQMHSKSHSRSCKKGTKTCRFKYPRPPSTRTFIAKPTPPPDNMPLEVYKEQAQRTLKTIQQAVEQDDSTVEDIFQATGITQQDYENAYSALVKRNTIVFQRQPSEAWVNPYSEPLLKAWNANMDIQPVLDPYSCIMYIVSYISKAERELGDLLRRAQQDAEQGHLQPVQQLRQLGNIYINHREISIMEAIYRVTGMKLKQTSREVVFVPTDSQTARLSKPLDVLENCTDEDNVWMTSLIDRYLARPATPEFEDMCLATFASCYKVGRTASIQIANEDEQIPNEDAQSTDDGIEMEKSTHKSFTLQRGLGTISRRSKPAVVRYPHFNKDKDEERYFSNLIRMYLPHRAAEIIPQENDTFGAIFEQHKGTILKNMSSFEKLTQKLDDAWQQLQQDACHDDAWADLASNQEPDRADQDEELEILRKHLQEQGIEIDPGDIPDLASTSNSSAPHQKNQPKAPPSVTIDPQPGLSTKDHMTRLRSLNKKQMELFYFVRNWALRKAAGLDAPSFHIFLTGGGGTGKSHLIHCIQHEVCKTILPPSDNPDSPVVLLTAPTGTAAYNIGGQTIHSQFGINKTTAKTLPEDQANTLRSKLQDVQLLIIDEVSMVSPSLLSTIHSRLDKIKQPASSATFFGNISVLAVGDFYQLPPVMDKQLCTQMNKLTDLWSLFHIWELDEVVRQQEDKKFASLLNRLRIRNKSSPIDAHDQRLLNSRLISKSDANYPFTALHLFPTNRQLQQHNDIMLKEVQKENPATIITAVDISVDPKAQKSYRRKEPLDQQNTSLPACLSLCQKARVMLSTNIDVSDGLTNGIMGTVTAIIPGALPLGQPAAVCVLFDDPHAGSHARKSSTLPRQVDSNSVVIKPHTEVIQYKPYQVTRHQFPLKLSWAVTIHKVQGMTTNQAVVSLNKVFQPGMAYVALSRLTSLQGLYLIKEDYDPNTIYSNQKIHNAISTMPLASSIPSWKLFLPPEPSNFLNDLMIVSHNTEGLFPHLQDILANKFLLTADIIALQETWLKPTQNFLNPLPNYSLLVQHRKDQYSSISGIGSLLQPGKGGVLLFIHQDLAYNSINTSDVQLECLAVEIHSPPVTVINIYRPPHLPLQHLSNQLHILLHKVATPTAVLLGDFNVNLLKTKTLPPPLSNLQQLIQQPTTRGCTLLDHIYISCNQTNQFTFGVVSFYYSYHDLTYLAIPCSSDNTD